MYMIMVAFRLTLQSHQTRNGNVRQFNADAPKRNPGNVLGCVSDDQTDK